MTNEINPLDNFQFNNDGDNIPKWQLVLGGVIIIIIVISGFVIFKIRNSSSPIVFDNKNTNNIYSSENYLADDDNDGLLNSEEEIWGTDPGIADTDGDGYTDYDEISDGYNPLGKGKLSTVEIANTNNTINQNNLLFEKEIINNWVDSFSKRSHSDGGFNTFEERIGDMDSDGISNILEQAYGLDPKNSDTDGDGKYDKDELRNYENPLGPGTIPEEIVNIINNAEGHLLFFDNCNKARFKDSPSVDDGDDCLIASAILTNKTSYCEKTKSGEYDERGDCYTNLAIINIDEKYCLNIPKSKGVGNHRDDRVYCLQKIAVMKKNILICNNIPFYFDNLTAADSCPKYGCYALIARETGNMGICEGMLDLIEVDMANYYLTSSIYNNKIPVNYIDNSTNEPNQIILRKLQIEDYWHCLINIASYRADIKICDQLTDVTTKMKQDCYEAVARNSKDSAICDIITNKYAKQNCYNSVARNSGDMNLCNKITTKSIRDHCLRAITVEAGDIASCKLQQSQEAIDNCILEINKTKKDPDVCRQITTSHIHDYCIDILVKDSNDTKLCELYKNDTKKSTCYQDFAEDKADVELCYMIPDDKEQYNCVKFFVTTKDNLNFCENLSNIFYQNKCYVYCAKKFPDLTICDRIEIDEDKPSLGQQPLDECLSNYAYTDPSEELCERINAEKYKMVCYSSLARKTGNKDYCSLISNELLRNSCLGIYN